MKRNLEEIIEEIKNLDNDLINMNISNGVFKMWKEGDTQGNTKEDWDENAEDQKKDAINFITRKYEQFDKKDYYTERDYEIADFKTFEMYFRIIKDEKVKKEIDKELEKKMEKFTNRLSNVLDND